MPQLPIYVSKPTQTAVSISPRATPADFGAGTGLQHAGAALGTAADALNKVNEQDDASAASRMVAELRSRYAIKLHEDMKYAESQLYTPTVTTGAQATTGGGGEPDQQAAPVNVGGQPISSLSYKDFSTKFVNGLNDEIIKLRGNMRTRHGVTVFDNMMANLRGDFTTRAFEAQADLAGKKAVVDYNATLNSNANTLMADPTHFNAILKDTQETLASMTNIPAGMRDQLFKQTTEKLAVAAGRGLIDANPVTALEILRSGKYNELVSPEQMHQLQGEALTEMKALEVMAEKLRKQQEEQAKLQRNDTNNDFLEKYEKGALTWEDVKKSNLLAMGEGSKNFWLNMLEKQAKEGVTVKTDHETYWELSKRIDLPFGDPRKITDPDTLLAFQDRVSISDLRGLRASVMQAKGEDGGKLQADITRFLNGMRGQFTKSAYGLPDAQGDESFYAYDIALRNEVEKYREQNKDPRTLLDPRSPNYFGNTAKAFIKSQAQRIKEISEGVKEEYGKKANGGVDESVYPPAPTDPKFLERGRVYRTPSGVMTWTGDGFLRGPRTWDPDKKEWSK